ncbi:MAG: S1 RNA-binding domain-containing protein [Bacilli bacterium]|nr:S1 RNA-binding domain-containing protein [Bacilli bacterium]
MDSIKVGKIVEGQITGITKYGVFVSLEDNYVGMVHISEVSNKFVSDLNDDFKIGDIVRVKVLSIDEDKLQVKLSIKKVGAAARKRKKIEESGSGFEVLKDKLPIWVDEKIKELEKND